MTARPIFSPQISLGTIVTILTLIVSVSAAYTYTRAAVEQNTSAIAQVRGQFERLDAATGEQIGALETRVRATEVRAERQGGEFNALSSALADIKQQQRENNQLLRELLQRSSNQ